MRLFLASLAVLVAFGSTGVAQDRAADVQIAFARAQHLKHGINASEWFAQRGNYPAEFTDHYIDANDIALMSKMGFDYVRLSIDAVPLDNAFRGWGGPNDDFLPRLDKAVDTMLGDGLSVIIDVHPQDDYKQRMRSDNEAVERFTMLWRKLAAHYASRDPERVFFEILNEPEINDPYRWDGIQARVAAAIRQAAPHHTIIATGASWSDVTDLLGIEPLVDGNVIYNFHFYDPSEFAQQGATWSVPYWSYTHNIPYPATESSMQELLKEVPDPVNRFYLERYWLDHWDAHRIKLTIDAAADWGRDNHVPLMCNEFGSYRPATDPVSRANWLHDVRTALEADGISWAMWDYSGSFGVVRKQEGQPAQVDDAVVKALGLSGRQ
ncbi:MAG: cellulase family glycosylhydrolase [Terracidiphilus sp.]